MKKLIAVALLFASLTGNAGSQTMLGEPDCADWVRNPVPAYRMWMLGFLSGLSSMGAPKYGNVLGKLSSTDQVFVWTDKYCREKPLNSLTEAGHDLFIDLVNKR